MRKRHLRRLTSLLMTFMLVLPLFGAFAADIDVTPAPVDPEYEEYADFMLEGDEDTGLEIVYEPPVTEVPSQFEEGYVCIPSGVTICEDVGLTRALGRFTAAGYAYARMAARGQGDSEKVVSVLFDTPELNAAGKVPVTGYVRLAQVRVLSGPECLALTDDLIMTAQCRKAGDVWLPISPFVEDPAAPTEAPTRRPTERPAEEPTVAPTEEPAEEPTQTPIIEETAPLSARFSALPRYGRAGVEVSVGVTVEGGVAPYTVSVNEDRTTADEAGEVFLTVMPRQWGDFALHAVVVDAEGAEATASAALPISDGAVESRADWEADIALIALSGDAAADLATVAESQVGYAESASNFIVTGAGERRGYTRYGDWAGSPYAEWNGLFVDFCMAYAHCDAEAFQRCGSEHMPMTGDVVYFDGGEMGIVASAEAARLTVIAGDWDDKVRERDYAVGAPEIVGYGSTAPIIEVEAEPVMTRATTVAEDVALYAEPTERSAALTIIEAAGTVMEAFETLENDEGAWTHVICAGLEGYVRAEALICEELDMAAMPLVFEQSVTMQGVTITVTGETSLFPVGTTLSVKRVPVPARKQVEAAVEQERDSEQNVAVSYTFDIKLLDAWGDEIEFTEGDGVQVSFTLAEAKNENLDAQVYHITEDDAGELTVAALKAITIGDTVVVDTDGFSYYTVEFTYGRLQYVLVGDGSALLSDILSAIGLTGRATAVAFSDDTLLSATSLGSGDWVVTALRPFDTEEWMRVTLDGIAYQITLTDGQDNSAVSGIQQGGDVDDFVSALPISTITLDASMLDANTNVTRSYTGSGFSVNGSWIRWSGAIDNNAATTIPGTMEFRYADAATLSNGSTADVVVTYSNITFYTDTRPTGKPEIWADLAEGIHFKNEIAFTEKNSASYNSGNNTYYRVALAMDINVRVVENANSTMTISPSDTFLFTVKDIDVVREQSNLNFTSVYGANADNKYFSEQVLVKSGAESDAYIPGSSIYLCIVRRDQSGSGGNGLLFLPTRGDPDPGTFASGFALLANARNGITVTTRNAGNSNAVVNSWIMRSQASVDIDSSTTVGGTIRTTHNGNSGGDLSDGSILEPEHFADTPDPLANGWPDNRDNRPGYFYHASVPLGKTVTYTMTPDIANGYGLRKVIVDGAEVTPTPVYDGSGKLQYYTFTFVDVQQNHKIHVEWVKPTTLEIKKDITGNMGNKDRAFDYSISMTFDNTYADNLVNHPLRYELTDAQGNVTTTTPTLGTGGTFSLNFSLSHGESMRFVNVPYDTRYTVTEANGEGYRATTTVVGDTIDGGAFSRQPIATHSGDTSASIAISDGGLIENTVVTYGNERTLAVPAGIHDSVAPALWLLMLALTGLSCAMAARRGRERRLRPHAHT